MHSSNTFWGGQWWVAMGRIEVEVKDKVVASLWWIRTFLTIFLFLLLVDFFKTQSLDG